MFSDTGATWDTPPVDLDRDECLKQQQNLDFLSVLSPTDIVTPHPDLFESDIDSNLAAFTDHLQLFTVDSNDAYNFFRTETPQWQGPLSTSSDSFESLSTYSESFYSEFSNYQRRANLNTDLERPFFDFANLDMDFQRIVVGSDYSTVSPSVNIMDDTGDPISYMALPKNSPPTSPPNGSNLAKVFDKPYTRRSSYSDYESSEVTHLDHELPNSKISNPTK